MALQKTEWQVVEGEGENVITGLTKREAFIEFANNKEATELRKVVRKCHEGETWESDDFTDEWQQVETVIRTRELNK